MASGRILVVDDDRNILELITLRLESTGYDVVAVQDTDTALEAMRDNVFDLAVLDLQLAGKSGITLMEDLHEINADLPVVILTAHATIESAVDAMQRGAFNYLTKPFDARALILQIERALEKGRMFSEIKRLKRMIVERYEFSNILAKSKAMLDVINKVMRISPTNSTVYLYGESGTGKELIARAIHLNSDRKGKPLVPINCAAIPESLFESELFGFERGAFTGADKSRDGLIKQAAGGSLFLDEIGEMPLTVQSKFLRVLQEKEFQPLGSKKVVAADCRVICATNRDLAEEVKKGNFREDLYYRINVIPVEIPPLRDRKEDIPLLAEHFLQKFATATKKKIKGFTANAFQKLMVYDWPGNVRELENTIEYAVVMATSDLLTEELVLTKGESVEPLLPLSEARQIFEKKYLINVMSISGGNVTQAAKLAGKYRADFYNLLKKYDLAPADFKE